MKYIKFIMKTIERTSHESFKHEIGLCDVGKGTKMFKIMCQIIVSFQSGFTSLQQSGKVI